MFRFAPILLLLVLCAGSGCRKTTGDAKDAASEGRVAIAASSPVQGERSAEKGSPNLPGEKPGEAVGRPFEFAADAGGQYLAKLLPPAGLEPLAPPARSAQVPHRTVASIAEPRLPLRPLEGLVIRLPERPLRVPGVIAEPEVIPPETALDSPPIPDRGPLPTYRVPTYAKLTPEQVPTPTSPATADNLPTDDPTLRFSADRVVGAPLPLRTTPVPFQPIPVARPQPFRGLVPTITSEPAQQLPQIPMETVPLP